MQANKSHVREPTCQGCPHAARHLHPAQACWGQAHLRLPRRQWLETAAPPPPEPQQQRKAQPAQQHLFVSEARHTIAQQSACAVSQLLSLWRCRWPSCTAGPSGTANTASAAQGLTGTHPAGTAPEPCQSDGLALRVQGELTLAVDSLAALWTWAKLPRAEQTVTPLPVRCMQRPSGCTTC